jgi:hypothetical protein
MFAVSLTNYKNLDDAVNYIASDETRLKSFLSYLSDEMFNQAEKDKGKGYGKLSNLGITISMDFFYAKGLLEDSLNESLKPVAQEVGNLRYDIMINFTKKLYNKTENSALHSALGVLRNMFNLSYKYMEDLFNK